MASNRIKGITIEINGDSTKLQDSLRDVDKQLSTTQSELKDVNRLLKYNPENAELLKQKQDLLNKSVKETSDRLKILQDYQKNMVDESGNVKDGLSDAYEKVQREIIETESKLENLKNKQKDFGSVTAQQLEDVGDYFTKLGDKMSQIGSSLTKYVTAPIVGFGGLAFSAFNEVDSALDTVTKKTGATGEALEGMQDSVKNIATTMPEDFNTIAEAIGEVNTRFGLTGTELEDVSEKFVEFASLNDTDVSNAIDVTQKALSAYGVSTEQVGTVLDVLNRTSQNTGVTFETLTNGLIQNGAAFQEMGLGIEQSISFMGQLEKSGANSETVMNGLRKALKNATEDGIPLNEALADIQDTIENGKGSIDGLTASYELFGKSGDQIYKAVKNGSINFTELSDTADILADSLDSVKNTYQQTIDPIDTMKTTMNQLKITGADIAQDVMPMVKDILDVVAESAKELSKWWSKLTDKQKDIIVKVGEFSVVAGPLVSLLGKIYDGIGGVFKGAGKLKGGFDALIGILSGTGGLVALLVGLAGAVAYGIWAEYNTEAGIAIQQSEELKGKIEDINNEVKGQIEYFDGSAEMARELADNLELLDNKAQIEPLSPEDMTTMETLVAKLNELYPELDLHIDEVTGSLTEESKARLNNIESIIQEAKAEALRGAIAENYKTEIELQKQKYDLQQKIAQEEYEIAKTEANRGKSGYDDVALDQDIAEHTENLNNYKAALDGVNQGLDESASNEEWYKQQLEGVMETTDAATESEQNHANAFVASEEEKSKAIANFATNTQIATNMMAETTNTTKQAILDKILSMGEEGAVYLQEFINQCRDGTYNADEFLNQMGWKFDETSGTIVTSMNSAAGAVDDASGSVTDFKNNTDASLDEAQQKAEHLRNKWNDLRFPTKYAKVFVESEGSRVFGKVQRYAIADKIPYLFSSPTFAMIGDTPDGEILLGKDKFDQLVNNSNSTVNLGGITIYQQSGESSDELVNKLEQKLISRVRRVNKSWR